jgi:hypothetical protein
MNRRTRRFTDVAARAAVVLSLGGLLAACETAPPPRHARAEPPAEAVPPQRVYFSPQRDQTPEQQDRDRYECYNWAVRETGFDPSRRAIRPEQRQAAVPAPSSAAALGGAVVGAVLGAAVSSPGNAGSGAIVGGVAGGLLGAAAQESANAEAERYNRAQTRRYDRGYGRELSEYRRAMSACLEGRGYSVK